MNAFDPTTFDATKWADHWREVYATNPGIATDDGTMISWFANALQAGYDHARREEVEMIPEREQLAGFDCSAGFCGGLGGDNGGNRPTFPDDVAKPIRDDLHRIMTESDNAAQPLTCANCTEISTNPGQFLKDGRWICSKVCRDELCEKQSYDDLAASGGIVDAP